MDKIFSTVMEHESYEIYGFRRGVVEVFALLWGSAA